MSPDDAKKAIDIGADTIMISNHGGRQLDGSRSPFDQLEIVDKVGGKIEIICDGGMKRTHILKHYLKELMHVQVEDYTSMHLLLVVLMVLKNQ